MYDEVNTGTNLPAEIKIAATDGDAYKFLFIAKGGGSANKSYLFQETKALLNEATLLPWLFEKMQSLGTAACPPYHLAVVIGGTSAEFAVETAKLASTHYLDQLPTAGSPAGHAFRDIELEAKVLELRTAHRHRRPVRRQVLLPRRAHRAPPPSRGELPGGDGRVVLGRPPGAGQDHGRGRVPRTARARSGAVPARRGRRAPRRRCAPKSRSCASTSRVPMPEILAELSKYPVRTRVMLTGPMVVARDIAHAKIKERLDAGEPMPQYLRDHCVYYAGPAKTPAGYASGSFGPTTAGRMDSYVAQFQSAGGSMVMLAKGNRSKQVTDSCREHGGFYLGSIGGPAARLALDNIKHVEVLEYPELGMEAVWKIDVRRLPRVHRRRRQGQRLLRSRPPRGAGPTGQRRLTGADGISRPASRDREVEAGRPHGAAPPAPRRSAPRPSAHPS